MKHHTVCIFLSVLLLELFGSQAMARQHHRVHRVQSAASRPSDCYGIPWCGCYLRHYFGLNDTGLNTAASWARVGQATSARSGAIVVWPNHVGVMKSDPDASGKAMVLSGNDGGGQARERLRSIRGAIAFREL
jgi:hypothetical protein